MKIVILAGGRGKRLWPISRDCYPKQFLKLGDSLSLLQKTASRFNPNDTYILTSPEYVSLVKNQLPEHAVIEEPTPKNTAPALAFAVRSIETMFPSDVILAVPSDHFISPVEKLLEAIQYAEEAAKKGSLVIFGVKPYKPETSYGYIQIEPTLRFVEKPILEKAEEYVKSGRYLWNSGMVAFTPKTFWNEIGQHAPEMMGDFSTMPEISFDFAVLEKTQNLTCIPLDARWSDLGTWESIFDFMEKDQNHNVKIGKIEEKRTKNSLIYGERRTISAHGFTDALIIETADALFLGKKGNSELLKKMAPIKRQGMEMVIDGKILEENQTLFISAQEDTLEIRRL